MRRLARFQIQHTLGDKVLPLVSIHIYDGIHGRVNTKCRNGMNRVTTVLDINRYYHNDVDYWINFYLYNRTPE